MGRAAPGAKGQKAAALGAAVAGQVGRKPLFNCSNSPKQNTN